MVQRLIGFDLQNTHNLRLGVYILKEWTYVLIFRALTLCIAVSLCFPAVSTAIGSRTNGSKVQVKTVFSRIWDLYLKNCGTSMIGISSKVSTGVCLAIPNVFSYIVVCCTCLSCHPHRTLGQQRLILDQPRGKLRPARTSEAACGCKWCQPWHERCVRAS